MKIAAALRNTLQDFPGEIAAEIFTAGCNFRCPYCHARPIVSGIMPEISTDDFLSYCRDSMGWITGVSICGGEPSLQQDLLPFMRQLKGMGLAIKIDTNGSRPDILERILAEKLADYAAMDIKGPPELWPQYTGMGADFPVDSVKESILLVRRFERHEYRTTAAPVVRCGGGITFITAAEIGEAARFVAGITGDSTHPYYIQRFVPRQGGLIDSRLELFTRTPDNLLAEMQAAAAKWLPNVQLRG